MSTADPIGVANRTTDDAFLGGLVTVSQPRTGYRAGIDAVLLAASVPAVSGARVLDLGAGAGTIGLCVAARLPGVEVVLLEREPLLVQLAQRNIERNGFSRRVRVVEADLEGPADTLGVAADSFDYVLANPPYQTEGDGRASPDALKARAHAMPAGGLDRWVRVMARLAKPEGTAAIVHRADALGDILAAFKGRFGSIAVLPLYPREGEAAVRVIVSGVKGSRAPLSILPGLVMHQTGAQEFTPRLQAILREGQALPLAK
jgi:tRNA1(Val) A37 N6-methylase TrmN6